jgi:hypothetical protein
MRGIASSSAFLFTLSADKFHSEAQPKNLLRSYINSHTLIVASPA